MGRLRKSNSLVTFSISDETIKLFNVALHRRYGKKLPHGVKSEFVDEAIRWKLISDAVRKVEERESQ